jgi:hypothetical protein
MAERYLRADFRYAYLPWQCLNFLPEPQGQTSLRPTLPQLAGSFGLRAGACGMRHAAMPVAPPMPCCASVSAPAIASAISSSPVVGSALCACIGGNGAGCC